MSADFVRYNLFCCELWQKVSFYIKWEQENNVKPLASVRRVADQRGRNLWLAGSNDPFLWLAGTNDPFLWLARAIEWSTTTRMAFNCNEVRFKNIIIRSRYADPAASTVYTGGHSSATIAISSTGTGTCPPWYGTGHHQVGIILIKKWSGIFCFISSKNTIDSMDILAPGHSYKVSCRNNNYTYVSSCSKRSLLQLLFTRVLKGWVFYLCTYTLSCPQKTIHSLPVRYQYLFCTYFAQDQQNFIIYKN